MKGNFLPMFTSLGAIVVVYLIILPGMGRDGLELDELGSFWVVKDGLSDAIHRSFAIQGQSPFYYIVLWALTQLFGYSELALSAISIFSAFISCLIIYKIGLLLFNKQSGIYAAVFFLTSIDVWQIIASARPYALANALALVSVLCSIHWLNSKSKIYLFLSSTFFVAAVYATYFFILLGPVIGVLGLIEYLGAPRPAKKILFKQSLIWVLLTIGLLFPTLYHLNILISKSGSLSFIPPPRIDDLLEPVTSSGCFMALLIVLGIIASYKVTVARSQPEPLIQYQLFRNEKVYFILFWFVFPIISIYLASRLFGISIFLPRYYSIATGANALLVGVILTLPRLKTLRILASVCFSVLVFAIISRLTIAFSDPGGFESATREITVRDPQGDCPVLLSSGFVESADPSLFQEPIVQDFLKSPVYYYTIKNQTVLIPYMVSSSEERRVFIDELSPTLTQNNCFWLLYRRFKLFIGDQYPSALYEELESIVPQFGFESIFTEDYSWVGLVLFEKKQLQSNLVQ